MKATLRHPDCFAAWAIISGLAARCRELVDEVYTLSFLSVTARLAGFLVGQVGAGSTLDRRRWTQEAIAALLGQLQAHRLLALDAVGLLQGGGVEPAHGLLALADDLAATVLLATDKPVLAAPAMNVRMWTHAATVANVETLKKRGVTFIGPNDGAMACNEHGPGRMSEPAEIAAAIESMLAANRPLAGKRALVTSGPTREAIDPVRYISNHSSGKQGHAIAAALARLGAEVTLVSGPVAVADPPEVRVVRVDSADQMLAACLAAGRVDVAVCAAAVADWKVTRTAGAKIKKKAGALPPALELAANPDILATLSKPGAKRPALVVGFAAETEDLVANAIAKRGRKGCDWIVANDVSPAIGTFGGERNTVHLVSAAGVENWPTLTKDEVAGRLAARMALHLAGPRSAEAAE